MIKNLYIENFRGFDKLKIDNIKKINFLVGKNNCGKTSVLESISLMISILNINTSYYINGIRRIKENPEELKNLFYNFNYENIIKFNYTLDTNNNYNLSVSPIMKKDKLFFNDIISLEYNFSIFYKDNKEKQNFKYSLENINDVDFNCEWKENTPSFYRYEFEVNEAADTFIDCSKLGKGAAFINGFNLGRYWSEGPACYLYVPAPLLKVGLNEIIIFETENIVQDSLALKENPVYKDVKKA